MLNSEIPMKVKNPGPKDHALVIPRGDLLCWNFIDLLKFQITNPKKQTNNNDPNSKSQTKNNRVESIWNLEFEIYLEFGAWDL
jgi:hypothetical protein